MFADADLKRPAAGRRRALYMSGQGCALPTRLLIHASVYEQVLEDVLEVTSQLVLGDPLKPATAMGPIISESHRDRVLALIDRAKDEGAGELRAGGSAADVGVRLLYPADDILARRSTLGNCPRRGVRPGPFSVPL